MTAAVSHLSCVFFFLYNCSLYYVAEPFHQCEERNVAHTMRWFLFIVIVLLVFWCSVNSNFTFPLYILELTLILVIFCCCFDNSNSALINN